MTALLDHHRSVEFAKRLGHNVGRWKIIHPNRVYSGKCLECSAEGFVNLTNFRVKRECYGKLFESLCSGRITFSRCLGLSWIANLSHGSRRYSSCLAPNIRLVRLSFDRYGFQYFNRYFIRVCSTGVIIVTLGAKPDARLCRWFYQLTKVSLVLNNHRLCYAGTDREVRENDLLFPDGKIVTLAPADFRSVSVSRIK